LDSQWFLFVNRMHLNQARVIGSFDANASPDARTVAMLPHLRGEKCGDSVLWAEASPETRSALNHLDDLYLSAFQL